MSKTFNDLQTEAVNRTLVHLHDINLTNDYKYARIYNIDSFNPEDYIEIVLNSDSDSEYRSYSITFVTPTYTHRVDKRISSRSYLGISLVSFTVYTLNPEEYKFYLSKSKKSKSLTMAANEFGFITKHYESDGLTYFVTQSDNISTSKLYDLTNKLREVN
jgi:hypothetical protein